MCHAMKLTPGRHGPATSLSRRPGPQYVFRAGAQLRGVPRRASASPVTRQMRQSGITVAPMPR